MAKHSEGVMEPYLRSQNNPGDFDYDNDLNQTDKHGNVPLHTAVIQNNIEQLKWLLRQRGIKIDHKNHVGETPLLMSLRFTRSNDFVMQLIDAGCNVDVFTKLGETALHRAISRQSVYIAQQLVKRGANVDSQDSDLRTPLHYAIENSNEEAVCMLLYYNADVTILCNRNFSPFTYALYINRLYLADILFDYYHGFSTDVYGYTALHLAAWHKSSLAFNLVNAGADVNSVTANGDSALVFSLRYEKSHLFELMWLRLCHQILPRSRQPFLLTYIQTCCFSISEWLKCLYLVLESTIAFKLVEHCICYVNEGHVVGFFWEFLYAFNRKNVGLQDRLAIINICLSLGAQVNIHDVNLAIELYGINEEVEVFIDICDYSPPLNELSRRFIFPLPTFILACEDDCTSDIMVQLLQKQVESRYYISERNTRQQSIVNSLSYFALPVNQKQKLVQLYQVLEEHQQIVEKLQSVPEIPLLLELSRNQARKFIRQTYKIEKPYQFHSAVKKLCLPQRIKDIICFKVPLY